MGIVYRQKNTYMKRCDKCGKLTHYIYHIQLGLHSYNFCSNSCTGLAQQEYQYKEKNGITPQNLEPISDALEPEGDYE